MCFEQFNASYLNKSINFIQQFIHLKKEQQQHTEYSENVPNNLYICPFLNSSKCMCIAQVSLSYHSTSHKIHNNGVWMEESVCPFLTSSFALLATTSEEVTQCPLILSVTHLNCAEHLFCSISNTPSVTSIGLFSKNGLVKVSLMHRVFILCASHVPWEAEFQDITHGRIDLHTGPQPVWTAASLYSLFYNQLRILHWFFD